MKGYRDHLEALRKQAAEVALISALATSRQKRDLFAKIAEHLSTLAAGLERGFMTDFMSDDGKPPARIGLGPEVGDLEDTCGCRSRNRRSQRRARTEP